jgi:acyl carrier protein
MPGHSVDPTVAVFLAAADVSRHRAGDLTRDHRFDGLGFDSLDRITFVVAIERATGQPVPDLVMATAATLGDLIDHLTDPEGRP